MEHSVSLYIHIPFCLSKCTYCDFFSVPCGGGGIPDTYIDAVLQESAYRAEINNIDSWRTIYIGGGTPSLLTEPQIHRLFTGLAAVVGEKLSCETTIECNPCDIEEKKLAAFENAGVTRLSCGIQSFCGNVLRTVRRRSSPDSIHLALSCIQKYWHGLFSADMISALPGETEESFAAGLDSLLAYKPDHISLYSLTVEKETPLGEKIFSKKIPYDFDWADALWIFGRNYLCSHGYEEYEVSNFCRDGKKCLHNLAYWNQENYIGCGAGATGTIYGGRKLLSVRETNTRNIAAYIDFWQGSKKTFTEIPAETEYITPETAAFEFFMMGLRTSAGICRETYEEKFGITFSDKIEHLFCDWEKTGRCIKYEKNTRHFYALTGKGILFLNEFLESLL
ncbi:MAG: radical SAM family heme chaperone HemW [Treponema sp.]